MVHFVENVTMTVETCCKCGIKFAAPREFFEQRRKDRAPFHCPNGHSQHYAKSEADKLREELVWEKKKAGWTADDLARTKNELRSQKYKTMAERSAKARLQKRIAGGICPCCHRTFHQLSRHMQDMHPDYAVEDAKKQEPKKLP